MRNKYPIGAVHQHQEDLTRAQRHGDVEKQITHARMMRNNVILSETGIMSLCILLELRRKIDAPNKQKVHIYICG